jgi:hypothetical protein
VKWLRMKSVPNETPVRDADGRVYKWHEGKLWTLNPNGAWYSPPYLKPYGTLALIENPGWWM